MDSMHSQAHRRCVLRSASLHSPLLMLVPPSGAYPQDCICGNEPAKLKLCLPACQVLDADGKDRTPRPLLCGPLPPGMRPLVALLSDVSAGANEDGRALSRTSSMRASSRAGGACGVGTALKSIAQRDTVCSVCCPSSRTHASM